MSSVYGRKVKEPKVTSRGTLPSSKAEAQAKGLEQAWSNFGEAKSVLDRLEGRAGSLNKDDPTLPSSYAQRPVKKRNVKFDSGAATSHSFQPRSRGGRTGLTVEDLENKSRGNEYVLEPTALNDEDKMSHHQERGGYSPSHSRSYSSPLSASTKRSAPVLNTSRSVQFTPTPISSSSTTTTSYRSAVAATSSSSSFSHAGAALGGTVPSSYSSSSFSHSNKGAVFGPPVKFGSWDKSRPILEGAEQPRPPSSHHYTLPSSSTVTTSTYATGLSLKPSTATMSLYPSSSSSAHFDSDPTHRHQLPVWTSPLDKQVPLRKFEVPAETLSGLKASVAEQKRIVQVTGSRVKSLKQHQPLHEKPGFFPLSEASSRGNSTQATPTHTHVAPPPPNPSHYSGYKYQQDELHTAKKRKVAPAPPPSVYAGFSSTDVTGTHQSRPSKPHPTYSGKYGGTASKGSLQGKGVNLPRSGYQYSHPSSGVGAQSRVRKVHRFDSDGGRDAVSAGDVITPASWRTGKELAEKILREQEERRQQQREHQQAYKPSPRSPSPSSQLSSYRDSLDVDSHSTHSVLSRSYASLSDTTSQGENEAPPSRPRAPSPGRRVDGGVMGGTDSGSEDPFRGSVPERQPLQLSSEVNQLLQELESSPRREPKSNAAGGKGERPLGGKVRGQGPSAEPAAKKTKYISEPVYTAEKVRRYDPSEVQLYIQRKKEERQRKALEEQKSQERAAKRREERLKDLYETQRRRVEANLRLKQKQREALAKAELAAAGIHIHLHDPSDSESSLVPPRIVVQPPRGSERPTSRSPSPSPRASGHSPTSKIGTSHSAHASPFYHHYHPSPPTHPPPVSAHTSPPRYSSFHHTPRGGEGSSRRSHSPHDHRSNVDRSPVSPRTYSVPSSKSLSPARGYTSQHHAATPPGATPSASGEYIGQVRSTLRYGDVPVTSTSYSFKATHSSATPTSRAYTSRYGTTPTQGASHVTQGASPRSSSSGKLAGLLKGTEYSVYDNQQRSREERIQAITAAALDLKQRIMEQSRKLAGAGAAVGDLSDSVSPSPLSGAGRRRRYQPHVSPQGGAVDTDLPGVRSLQQHATQADRLRKETEAARKIQASYRGYQVRKSLHWQLPSGGTLGGVLRGTRNVGDGVEGEDSDDNTLTPKDESDEVIAGSGPATPTRSWKDRGLRETTPPLSVPNEPWKQTGGDAHSVINVFARQHEANWKKPVGQDSQRSPSSKGQSPRHSSPIHSTGHTDDHTHGAGDNSYSQIFDSPPSSSVISALDVSRGGGGVSEVDGGQMDEHGSPFSQDSLLSEDNLTPRRGPHSSSDHTPIATPSVQRFVSAHSSVQSSDHTPMTTPPSQGHTHHKCPSPPPTTSVVSALKSVQTTTSSSTVISVITPPGSPSFMDSFVSSACAKPVPPLPPFGTSGIEPSASQEEGEGRLSPRALEMQMQIQLNLLETVEDSMRQVNQVESNWTRAQLLKDKQQEHDKEVQTLASRASDGAKRRELAEEEARQAQAEMESRIREQAGQLTQMKQESDRAVAGLTTRLSEVEATTARAVANQMQQQQQVGVAGSVALTVAAVAAKEAVREVLKNTGSKVDVGQENTDQAEVSYKSDFESGSSTLNTESLLRPPDYPFPMASGAGTEVVSEGDASVTSIPESITPVPSDREDQEKARSADDEQESNEEEIKEVSLREILPSESHRRQQTFYSSSHLRPPPLRTRNDSSEIEERASSPSLMGGSRPGTPSISDASLFSPRGTEDSFFHFMSRMVHSYVQEEEMRARHQAALLQLRESAIKEKTKAELEWLKLQERDLKSKGADDQMPPLRKREKGLLKKLQQEQEEIQTLKEVQEAARQERKLMLLQQKEISKMRRDTQYYRKKIHRYRQHSRASVSPDRSRPRDPFSPVPSLDRTGRGRGTDDNSFSVGPSDVERDSSVAPSEHLEDSFPTYTPVRSGEVTLRSPDLSSNRSTPASRVVTRSPNTLSPMTATAATNSLTVKNLKKLSTTDPERSLAQREQRLLKRRQAAEEALKQQMDLLQKERHLDKEEESVNKLVSQVMDTYEQRQSMLKSPRRSTEKRKGWSSSSGTSSRTASKETVVERSESIKEQFSEPPSQTVTAPSPPITSVSSKHHSTSTTSSSTIQEAITEGGVASASQIRTEMSPEAVSRIPSEYLQDTFTSLDSTLVSGQGAVGRGREVVTSTPALEGAVFPGAVDQEYSLSESLRLSESISETMTVTSDGSAIEARIRSLKQQLRQRQKEEKRVRNEKNRKRKAMLKQHERQLEKKLEAVKSRVSKMKSSTVLFSETASSAHSHSHSEVSADSKQSSRGQSPSPDETYTLSDEGTERRELSYRKEPGQSRTIAREDSIPESSATQSPAEEQSSPVAPQGVTPYTSFTESMESKVSEEILSTDRSETEESMTSQSLKEEGGGDTTSLPRYVSDRASEHDHTHGHTPEAVTEEILSPEEDLEGDETLTESRLRPGEGVSSPEEQGANETVTQNGYYDENQEYSTNFEPDNVGMEREQVEPYPQSPSTELLVQSEQIAAKLRENSPPDDVTPPHLGQLANTREQSDSDHSDSYPPLNSQAERARERSDSERSDTLSSSATPSQGGDFEDQDRFQPGQLVLIANKIEGVVRFVGTTHFARGVWVGVEIGVPKGRNDGSINGKRYFQCEPNYGLFVPPRKLAVMEEEVEEEVKEEAVLEGEQELNKQEVQQDMEMEGSDEEEVGGILRTDEEYSLRDSKRMQNESLGEITEEISTESLKSDVTTSEIPAPASTGLETRGEKPDSLPLAPEVASQRSQSATPTPAPPPEFAEGASRESSMEPPAFMFPSITESHKPPSDHSAVSDRLSEELAQDLTNEAYEAMHKIWKAKQQDGGVELEEEKEVKIDERSAPVLSPKEKFGLMTIDQKADQITNELLALLLQAESNLACNIHASKKTDEDRKEVEKDPESVSPEAVSDQNVEPSPERSLERTVLPVSHPVASPSQASRENDEPLSPTKRFLPPPHLIINTATGMHIESSPPLLSPPSPYRSPPPGTTSPADFSPPGSPPRHLAQSSAARVAAGERSPFSTHQDSQTAKKPSLERSISTDSVYSLLDSIKITTAQCMVPSERENINDIISRAWEAAKRIGVEQLHGTHIECPADVLRLFNNMREMSPDEERCQMAYVRLVYQLTLESIRRMCPPKQDLPVWSGHCTVRSLLAPTHFPNKEVSLEELQRRVYASLMRGQLPSQLPAVKFLNKMKRPGGREIDFVDQILIRELRGEEPGWVDYSKDEVIVKEKAADALLESLIDETVGVLRDITEKRRMREMNRQHMVDCY